ncbi:propionyl-CoA synthetase [Hasllibacter halocynthiae]|uniref:Propionyl-CoA synthetase n=1 Tax=Hasllibacter halocynthiae TaxID=595589 RepID=A0A2T0X462_9RHOB|nr:AMP-binding protein [Hasllibacter halocynthiae]PRY93731.1 propionyl-CoA synthetase [Hasllibacter halocynthiae]
MGYRETYEAWRADPEGFWMEAARGLDWDRFPTRALTGEAPVHRWFADGTLNTCHECVDRHVAAGKGDRPAIVHDSPVTGTKRTLTYGELRDATARLAGALRRHGVLSGDRVVIYMPMIPEAVVAMLACARIGAVHSVVFGGFAANELAVRLDDCAPKAVIAASCGIEPGRVVEYGPLLQDALELAAHAPEFCVVLQRTEAESRLQPGRDVDWHDFQDGAEPAGCVSVPGDHPAYILYTSGTTGRPKGVVRTAGGHLVALRWTMQNVYGVRPGDVFWTASDVGWVVGHSYIVYGPLANGNTTVLYEGKPVGTPDAAAFWRVIEEHRVGVLFTAPTAFRAIKRADPGGALVDRHDLSSLRALFLAGERADPDTVDWAKAKLGVPVIDHWWQTETGWAIAANPLGLGLEDVPTGSPGRAMPGYEVAVLDEGGAPVPAGALGSIAVRLPLPPGTLAGLWNGGERFEKTYLSAFPGFYATGDAGTTDEDGNLFVMARTDDVINVAGHRLSTGAMEEVLAGHPDVAECAVIGVADELKGQLPLGLLCLNDGAARPPEDVAAECVARIRAEIGPVAAFRTAVVVDRLPKTRSGKILRGTMAAIADGREWRMPATIDDPAILDEIAVALHGRRRPRTGDRRPEGAS